MAITVQANPFQLPTQMKFIMELIGKGVGNKGAVWVARMIPDGYVSGHANQARITTFPFATENNWFDENQTTFNSPDVITFAR